jgi:SpoVK/Ycf46/Vps4 family AAA+-type ATPase
MPPDPRSPVELLVLFVVVIDATNRRDQLDPAVLRGGRLSRTIVLGLPDEAGRLAMLRLHSGRMPTVGVRPPSPAAPRRF